MGLYRPTVTRKRNDGTRIKEKSRYWWGSFRHPATGQTVRRPFKTADKTAARTLLREAERRAAQEAAGLVNPYEEHHDRLLLDHVDEFERYLLNKGDTAKHARRTAGCVRGVIESCRWERWPDISPSRLLSYLANRRDSGTSIRTCNVILGAVKAFCRWMVADRRAGQDPVTYLRSQNTRTDTRRERRAFAPEELQRLLACTSDGPERHGLSGQERAVLYQLAVETGLRASELRSLTWACVALDADPPTLTVKAAYSKHRRDDTQPIPRCTAQMLLCWRNAQAHPARLAAVFPSLTQWTKTAAMLRADLEAARSAWIEDARTDAQRRERERSDFLEYVDEAGRYADFHSFRHTFITNLARAGVHPKVAQSLARHSTVTLTMDRYSHAVLADQVNALELLPNLSVDGLQAEEGQSPGTDAA